MLQIWGWQILQIFWWSGCIVKYVVNHHDHDMGENYDLKDDNDDDNDDDDDDDDNDDDDDICVSITLSY